MMVERQGHQVPILPLQQLWFFKKNNEKTSTNDVVIDNKIDTKVITDDKTGPHSYPITIEPTKPSSSQAPTQKTGSAALKATAVALVAFLGMQF